MPTVKFKSFEQAADALLLNPRTASAATRMRALFGLSARIAPSRCSSGVKKFRSLEEAAEDLHIQRQRPNVDVLQIQPHPLAESP